MAFENRLPVSPDGMVVQNVAALKGVASAGLVLGQQCQVVEDTAVVQWDPEAESPEDLPNGIVIPDDVTYPAPGRWVYTCQTSVSPENEFVVGTFSSVINVSQNTRVVYNGPVTDVELSAGTGPHISGCVYEILFPYGSVTGVAFGSGLRPAAQPVWDPLYAYRVIVTVFGTGYLLTSQRLEDPSDVEPPGIISAVLSADRQSVDVVFDESVTVGISGVTLTGTSASIISASGSGDSWSFALNSATAIPGDTLALVMASADIYDTNANRILDGSYPVTNGLSYPEIDSASVDSIENELVVSFSEAVDVADVTGMSLTGTAVTITGIGSGSGTSVVRFTLSGSVLSTVELSVSASNSIDSSVSGLGLQAVSGIVVEVTVPPGVVSAYTNTLGTELSVEFDEDVTVSDTTGLSLQGSTLAELGSVLSSGGTVAVFSMSPSASYGDTFTFDVTSPNTATSNVSGLSVQSGSTSVTNNTVEEIPPTIVSATADTNSLTVVFSEAVNVTGVTGISLNGTTAALSSVGSGSGTDTVVLTVSPVFQYGETITMDVTVPNDVASVASGAGLEAVSGVSVTNSTPDVTVYLNDPFDTLDPFWTNDSFDTLSVSGGELVIEGSSYGRTYYNSEVSPADVNVEATISSTQRDRGFWGLMARHDPATGTGIRLFSVSGSTGALTVGDTQGYTTGNVTVTVTGGFPASWSTSGSHTIGMALSGNTVTIYCDGSEYGTADVSSITTTGLLLGFCGAPQQNWANLTATDDV